MEKVEEIKVVNCKKKELNSRGIRDFTEWSKGEVLYIGRNMTFYVPGAIGSKWRNKFNVKKYGRDKCLELYEDYVRKTPDLWNSLEELLNYKELGCWCSPEACHGDVLLKLLKEKCC